MGWIHGSGDGMDLPWGSPGASRVSERSGKSPAEVIAAQEKARAEYAQLVAKREAREAAELAVIEAELGGVEAVEAEIDRLLVSLVEKYGVRAVESMRFNVLCLEDDVEGAELLRDLRSVQAHLER